MTSALYTVPAADLWGLAPELLLTGGGVLALLLDAFFPRLSRWTMPVSLVAVALALFSIPGRLGHPDAEGFRGLLESNPLTAAVSAIILVSTALALLASSGFLRREELSAGEYYSLLLWCAAGLLLMTRAQELITLFVALELFSICLYTLAAYHRGLQVSAEAGIKYFLMGAFVSAFVLLGIAFLYGEAGTTRLEDLASYFAGGGEVSALSVLGLLLLVAGFGFKMSVAPFHAWAPDTYQGAPSPFVGFLSVAPKAASAVVLVRVLELAFLDADGKWSQVVAALAILSMTLGNVLALVQRDIKRMLAYSGVAHMGYLLVALVTLDDGSLEALTVYLLAYALMNAGAFAVIGILYTEPGEQHLISDLGGLGYRFPVLSACLAICLLSLGGIPPTLGFLGKYLIFVQALDAGNLWLALVVVGTSLIGVFYYLRVMYTLYMRPRVREAVEPVPDSWGRVAALAAAGATLAIGLWPGKLLSWVYEIAARGF